MQEAAILGISPRALTLYRQLMEAGSKLIEDCPADCLAELSQLNLVLIDGIRVAPEAPRPMLDARLSELQKQVDLATATANDLALQYNRSPGRSETSIDVLHGKNAVLSIYLDIMNQAREEVLGFDRGPYVMLEDSPTPQQLQAMNRGVRFRAIYEGLSLQQPASRIDLKQCISAGEEARVLPKLPMKLIIQDHSKALLALTTTGGAEALVVRPSMLLSALRDLFEQMWELAIPASVAIDHDMGQSEGSRELLTLLSSGLTDETISRELGISVRTLQRRIASLQRMLGASTRFQLGVQATRRGWI